MNSEPRLAARLFFGHKLTLRQLVTPRRSGCWAAALLAAAVLAGVGWSRSTNSGVEEPRTLPLVVDVMPLVESSSYEEPRTYSGTVHPRRSSQLSFRRADELTEVLVDQGAYVTACSTLARLDTRTTESEQAQLQAQRAEAQAVLDELMAGPRTEVVDAQRARVDDFAAQLARLQSQLRRRETLRERRVISEEEYEQTTYELESAQARWQVARRSLEELEAGTRREQIVAQRAVLDRLQAALQRIEIDLTDSTLTAPFSGWITRRLADEGVILSPGQAVLEIVEEEPWEVWIGVPPESTSNLDVGGHYEMQIGERTYDGCVRAVLAELDPVTRTRTVILTLNEDTQQVVVPGQLARVCIPRRVAAAGYWVPLAALTRDTGGLWSLLVAEPTENALHVIGRRLVEVVYSEGERAFVRGTIQAGDLAVTHGVHRLALGQFVHLR